MSNITNLQNLYQEKGKEFLDKLFKSKNITIYEKLNGLNFGFTLNEDNTIEYFRKNSKAKIGEIDRTLTSMYEFAIDHVESIKNILIENGLNGYSFYFQYFPNDNPVLISYNRLPDSKLVLNYFENDLNEKIFDKEELDRIADLTDTCPPPIIWQGTLANEQISKIYEYFKNNVLSDNFNFSEYFYNIILPENTFSYLQDDLKSHVEGFIFKFENERNETTFCKLINPYFEELAKKERDKNDTDDSYYIALLDIVNFLVQFDFTSIKLRNISFDLNYIDLCCIIFNKYVKAKSNRYKDFYIEVPDYLKREYQNVNITNITNQETLDNLKYSLTNQTLFKIILSSFRKKRKNTNHIFSEKVNEMFNDVVKLILDVCKIKSTDEDPLNESFITFDEFKKIYVLGQDSESVVGIDLDDYLRKQPAMVSSYIIPDFNVDEFLASTYVKTIKKEKKKIKDNRITVNLLIDNFSPLTNALNDFTITSYEKDKVPFLCVSVSQAMNMFTEEILTKVLNNLVEKDRFASYIFVDRPNIKRIVETLESKYKINRIYANDRYYRFIETQILDNFKNNNYLNLIELNDDSVEYYKTDNSFYQAMLNAIKNNDYIEFKKYAPEEYHSLFSLLMNTFHNY